MQISFRPLQQWPRPLTKTRRSSPFHSSYDQTLRLLDTELAHVGARNIVIQLALPESQIRADGLPYARSQPSHPGVILTFEKPGPFIQGQPRKYQTLNFPCDAFYDWTDNLRGIALGLEALRKIDRYGVTSHEEQYRGWAALPPADTNLNLEDAAQALVALSTNNAEHVQRVRNEPHVYTQLYRLAVKRWHPDANQGNQLPEWNRLQKASDVLAKHHRL